MVSVVLIRPGSTDYDEQGRITGRLDIPLSETGVGQIERASQEVTGLEIKHVFSAPDEASCQTADLIARRLDLKRKPLPLLQNLDPGLWQGKLIDEVKSQHPKIYKRWLEQPETICPPEGETIADARHRLCQVVKKFRRKVKDGNAAIVLPDPLASILAAMLKKGDVGDLWQTEENCGSWELIQIDEASSVTP